MDTATYIVLSRQTALFRKMDIIANNIANANTFGYKSESMEFREFVMKSDNNITSSYTQDFGLVRDLSNGSLRRTGRKLDVAIEGKGYFHVESPLGSRYTRVGSFHVNVEGSLVTSDGFTVQGDGGEVTLAETDTDITILEDGTIISKTSAGIEERGKIRVVIFNDERALEKLGNSYYSTNEIPVDAIVKEDYVIAHGMIEESNVNSTKELTDMIEVSRAVGTTSGFMDSMHEMTRRTISTLSKQQ